MLAPAVTVHRARPPGRPCTAQGWRVTPQKGAGSSRSPYALPTVPRTWGAASPQPPPTTGRGVKVGYALRARLRLRRA